MTRGIFVLVSASALIVGLHAAPALAQRGHGATPHGQTTGGGTTHGPSTKGGATHGPSTRGGTTHGPSTHGTAVQPKGHGGTKTHGTSAKSAGAGTTKTATSKTTTDKKTTDKKTVSTTTPTTTETRVQQQLEHNTALASKLESRLPAGTDLRTAADGFRNLGQFVAAVNVSRNLNIPFAQLKTDMVTNGMSLGQSIQHLRPAADAATETQRAEGQAQTLISQSSKKQPGR